MCMGHGFITSESQTGTDEIVVTQAPENPKKVERIRSRIRKKYNLDDIQDDGLYLEVRDQIADLAIQKYLRKGGQFVKKETHLLQRAYISGFMDRVPATEFWRAMNMTDKICMVQEVHSNTCVVLEFRSFREPSPEPDLHLHIHRIFSLALLVDESLGSS